MTTEEIIIHIFCAVDDGLGVVPKERNARLYAQRGDYYWHPVRVERWTFSSLLSLAETGLGWIVRWIARSDSTTAPTQAAGSAGGPVVG